jgi:AcrR family transcriptional regulator
MDDAGTVDMRTRNKLATRDAISAAALRLAIERGPGNVRVDDIATAAGVSPRTYNNYFSSREEAICAIITERAQRVSVALRARPAAEPLDEAITNTITQEYGAAEPDRVGMGLIASTPALRGEFLKGITTLEGPLAEAIAERTGLDPEHDLPPRVLAAAVAGAVRTATEHWLKPDTSTSFAAALREALTLITPTARAIDHRTT